MAIPSYVGATLDQEVNTFGDWFAQTNLLIGDMGTKVVSAEANTTGASTTGNVAIVGIFSANTIAVTNELRGGTVDGSSLLTVSSNTTFTGESLSANTSTFTVNSLNYVIAANVTTTSGNTITFNSGNTNFNGTNVNFSGTNVLFNSDIITFSGTDLVITSNTSFTANSITLSNVIIDETLTIGADAEIIFDELNFTSNVNFVDITAEDVVISNTATITTLNVTDATASANINAVHVHASANVTAYNITATSNIASGHVSATSANFSSIIIASIESDFNAQNITANNVTATNFNSTSDLNLKDNVNTLSNSIDVISQINPVSFTWKDTGIGSYGVIAQEIEKVLPEIVSEKDGVKTVAYTQIIAFLIGAIQEQQKEIEEIKSRLD